MDDEELKLFEATEEGVNDNYLNAKSLLKKYFKTQYENDGMEWTEVNDQEIDFIVEAIKNKTVFQSIKTIRDTIRSGKLK
jgi:hypothetical protein